LRRQSYARTTRPIHEKKKKKKTGNKGIRKYSDYGLIHLHGKAQKGGKKEGGKTWGKREADSTDFVVRAGKKKKKKRGGEKSAAKGEKTAALIQNKEKKREGNPGKENNALYGGSASRKKKEKVTS